MGFRTNNQWSKEGGRDQGGFNYVGLGDPFRRFWRALNGGRSSGLFYVSTRWRFCNYDEEELIASQFHTELGDFVTPFY